MTGGVGAGGVAGGVIGGGGATDTAAGMNDGGGMTAGVPPLATAWVPLAVTEKPLVIVSGGVWIGGVWIVVGGATS